MIRRAALAGLLVAVTASGCGGSSSPDSAPPPSSSTPSAASTVPTPGGVPTALQGVWAQPPQHGDPAQLLKITASTYGFYINPGDVAEGPLAAAGSTLTFETSTTCVGSGSYHWKLHGDVLRLTPEGPDPCPRGTFVAAHAWHRHAG
jgi:hypothetical protein